MKQWHVWRVLKYWLVVVFDCVNCNPETINHMMHGIICYERSRSRRRYDSHNVTRTVLSDAQYQLVIHGGRMPNGIHDFSMGQAVRVLPIYLNQLIAFVQSGVTRIGRSSRCDSGDQHGTTHVVATLDIESKLPVGIRLKANRHGSVLKGMHCTN